MLGFLLNLSREHLLELVHIIVKELPRGGGDEPGWWNADATFIKAK